MIRIRTLAAGLAALAAAIACSRAVMTRVPAGITPVTGFDVERYMGKWHEIARLDHRFERGMTDVSATYALNGDGTVRVVNRGLRNGRPKSITGTARFLGDPATASLAVTFFPGFPGGYHVIALDPDYRWAVVCGPDRGYLWILARAPRLDQATWQRLVAIARDNGFDTEGLILVPHDA
ncbi:lipocalin family protein [Paracoccus luteus]|uniref:lipocalin family protein n=1 Tax=Paracoccus luteus TaxID=2508543 RepID=UPI00106F177E|nr:lipocalin family protein [Paracoccus luteus]